MSAMHSLETGREGELLQANVDEDNFIFGEFCFDDLFPNNWNGF